MQFFGKKFEFSLGEERSRLLICIGISLLIWIMMKLSGSFYTTRHVNIDYELPSMIEFTEAPPEKLVATVHGTGLSIIGNYLRNPNPSITIDLRENTARNIEREEMLDASQRKLNMMVTNLDRNYLKFSLDSMVNKKVPVRLVHDAKFTTDFFPINGFQLSVDSVFISGTPDQLANISEVKTEKLTTPPISQDYKKTLKILAPPESGIQVVPSTIELNIEVAQFTEKKFTVPVNIPALKDSIQLIPSEVEVKCVVRLSNYAALQASDIQIEADIGTGVELAAQSTVAIKLIAYPASVRSIEMSPNVVDFFIVQ